MTSEQKSLWTLFNRIIDFLDSEGIRFYLLGGTAIGALRHHGFIPWDDDIDIMIEMPDYQRLLDMTDSLPWDDIELLSNEKDPLYFRPYARFSYKKETMFMKGGIFNHGKCMGTMIDVMPLYDVPSSMMEEFTHDFLLYQEAVTIATTYKTDISKYADEYYAVKERQRTEGRQKVFDEMRGKLLSYSAYPCDRKVVGLSGISKLRDYDAAWFAGEPKYVPFEGRLLPVPSGVEACLRYQYGYDWYMLPESQEQRTHKLYRDTDISSNNYFIDMSNFVDWDEADKLLEDRKKAQIEKLDMLLMINKDKERMYAQRIMMRSGLKAGDLEKICAGAKPEAYRETVERGRSIVAGIKSFRGIAPADVGLSDGDICALITALVYTGRYYDAIRVRVAFMEACKLDDGSLLDRTIRLCEAYQDKDREGMIQALAGFNDSESKSLPDCMVVCAYCLTHGIKSPLSEEDVKRAAIAYLEAFPDNSDVRKALADLYKKSGDTESAKTLYHKVVEESRNGLDILEIKTIRSHSFQ